MEEPDPSKGIQVRAYTELSQTQCSLHFEPSNSLLWGAVLCILERLAATLFSTHLMPVAFLPHAVTIKNVPDITKCLLRAKIPQLRTVTDEEKRRGEAVSQQVEPMSLERFLGFKDVTGETLLWGLLLEFLGW